MADPVIEEVKQKLDIVDVISHYLTLKKAGANYKGNCPFHAEKTPSFMVNRERQIYRCFGCGEAGDVFAFVMKQENVDFANALQLLAGQAGVALPERMATSSGPKKSDLVAVNNLSAKFFHTILMQHQVGKAARDYLIKRGVHEDFIKDFFIGYAPATDQALLALLKKK